MSIGNPLIEMAQSFDTLFHMNSFYIINGSEEIKVSKELYELFVAMGPYVHKTASQQIKELIEK